MQHTGPAIYLSFLIKFSLIIGYNDCTFIQIFMCVQLISKFDRKKVYYVTQVSKQGINIKTMCPNYIHEFKNTKSHLLQVYLDEWVKIEIVIENHACQIVGHCYYSFLSDVLVCII